MVYVSPSFYKVTSGYLPCHVSILGADHLAIWLDIPSLLLHLQPPPPSLARGCQLKADYPMVHDTYLQLYKSFCTQHKLFDWGKQLWQSVIQGQPLSIKQMMEFETIDALHTKGMNDAKKCCRKLQMGVIEWSPKIAMARNQIAAWTALLRTHKGIKINS